MDGYAPSYVGDNLPLLVVSGLGKSTEDSLPSSYKPLLDGEAIILKSSIASVDTQDAVRLRRYFQQASSESRVIDSQQGKPGQKPLAMRIKFVGRVSSAGKLLQDC
jgi:hypothetical protein